MRSHDKDGYGAYTMNANGEISIFMHHNMTDKIAHSSMNAGSPVVAAGEMMIKKGILQVITTHSGHYRPTLFNVSRALEYFVTHGIDIREAKVVTWDNPSPSVKGVESKEIVDNNELRGRYEMPAVQIYQHMDKLLDKYITAIHKQLQSYRSDNVLSSMYHLKDKLTRSELTTQRAKLATNFQTALSNFKGDLGKLSPADLSQKREELEKLINEYQGKNIQLSTEANKSESNGRLAKSIRGFKEELASVKVPTETSTPEEHAANLKKIS
jgi:hypothetical protein